MAFMASSSNLTTATPLLLGPAPLQQCELQPYVLPGRKPMGMQRLRRVWSSSPEGDGDPRGKRRTAGRSSSDFVREQERDGF